MLATGYSLLLSAGLDDTLHAAAGISAAAPFLCFPVATVLTLWLSRPPAHPAATVGVGAALGVIVTLCTVAACIGCYAIVAFFPALFGGAATGMGVSCAASREVLR